jgi:hypothetical protein
MVKHLFPILIILIFSGCSTTKDKVPQGFSITSFYQGKMKKIDDEYQIYDETNEMDYEINDRCMYSKEEINCLRHGFIISYDSLGLDVKLNCIAKTNMLIDAGNVAREKYTQTNQDDFYMELVGSETKFINPQYVSGDSGLSDLEIATSCHYQGKLVLSFTQRIHFPSK